MPTQSHSFQKIMVIRVAPRRKKRRPVEVHEDRSGFVYLINAVRTDRFKIGRTVNIKKRIDALQTSCPHPIQYVHSCYTNDSFSLENEFHRRFKKQRVSGEWFCFTRANIDEIILDLTLNHEQLLLDKFLNPSKHAFVFNDKDSLQKEPVKKVSAILLSNQCLPPLFRAIIKFCESRPGEFFTPSAISAGSRSVQKSLDGTNSASVEVKKACKALVETYKVGQITEDSRGSFRFGIHKNDLREFAEALEFWGEKS